MPSRVCKKCGVERDLESDFNKNPHSRDGHIWTCKGCVHEQRTGKPDYYKTLVCAGCTAKFQRRGRIGSWQYCPDCHSRGKVCKRCGEFKPLEKFGGTGDSARYCSDGCSQTVTRERRYNLLPGTAEAVFSQFVERCGICDASESLGPLKTLVIDHCHDTGQIRGFLCRQCNLALGLLKDNPELLRSALTYLERSRSLKSA